MPGAHERTSLEVHAEIRGDLTNISDRFFFEEHVLQGEREGEEPRPDRFHKEQFLGSSELYEDVEFGLIECSRLWKTNVNQNRSIKSMEKVGYADLFEQYMFACLESRFGIFILDSHHPLCISQLWQKAYMARMRRADVNYINVLRA